MASLTPLSLHCRRIENCRCGDGNYGTIQPARRCRRSSGKSSFKDLPVARGLTGYTCPGKPIRFLSMTMPRSSGDRWKRR